MIKILNYPTEEYNNDPKPNTKEVRADLYQNIITSFTMTLYVLENSEGGINVFSDNEESYHQEIPITEYSYEINNAEFNNWLEINKFIP